jgi:hypothetical protein
VLNSIARDCAIQGDPDLSALAVRSETALPGVAEARYQYSADNSTIHLPAPASAEHREPTAGNESLFAHGVNEVSGQSNLAMAWI